MNNPIFPKQDTCHKCGGEGIFLGSQQVGNTANGNVSTIHDYECKHSDCQATWMVWHELVPVSRENDND